jgi:hypothetical protein
MTPPSSGVLKGEQAAVIMRGGPETTPRPHADGVRRPRRLLRTALLTEPESCGGGHPFRGKGHVDRFTGSSSFGSRREALRRVATADRLRSGGHLEGPPRPPEPFEVVDQEEDELERVWEADEVKLRCRRQCHGRVLRIERAGEAGVWRAPRSRTDVPTYRSAEEGRRCSLEPAAPCANRAPRSPFMTLREPWGAQPENVRNPV